MTRMTSPRLNRCLTLAVIMLGLLCQAIPRPAHAARKPEPQEQANYFLGTQAIGCRYSFSDKTVLVETAEQIHAMGSNVLKFSMSRRYKGEHYRLPARDDINSLTDLASKEPSIRNVLDMPFAYYHIWTYSFAHGDAPFRDGLTRQEAVDIYNEVFRLSVYLLKKYNGTGKTFYLGHWEGDWHLHPNYDRNQDPDPKTIRGMIDWLKVRQKAIDDAKRKVRHRDVQLYHYTEVNLVQKGMNGGSCLVNDVLPHSNVDYVSYSSYDTTNPHKGHVAKALHEALDYIESKLPPKPDLKGKRVFIGEYGIPRQHAGSPQMQDAYARDVCLAAVEWGCPFVLYWQIYCNEQTGQDQYRGYWLIDNKGEKQPFYFTLHDYYQHMKQFVSDFDKDQGRPPTPSQIRQESIRYLRAIDKK